MDLATGLVSPLLALSVKLETSVNKFYQRKDLTEDNIEQLRRLQRQFADARDLIPKIEPRVAHDAVLHTRLRQFEQTLNTDTEKVDKWHDQIDLATAKKRVRRMKQILDRCEDNMRQLFDFLTTAVPPMPEPSSSDEERYIPRNTVPVNPPRLMLDYSDPGTCEGKLRAAILDHRGGRVVALVASGKGGVGKTCALRGLADDEQVNKVFPGGTLYIQLGNEAALTDIVQGLAHIVERTGGPRLAEKIRSTESLQEASQKASDWFVHQRCLFLVDDIWRVNGIDSDVFHILGSMVNERSRLVYTTRDRHFLERAHQSIEFEERKAEGDLARRMLMKHGGFDEADELDEQNKHAFEAILHECQGLPLAFGIVGGAVLKKSLRKTESRKQDAWSDFHADMVSKADGSKFFDYSAQQYGGLTRMVDASLQALNAQYESGKYHRLFRALCVLRKQQRVPLEMLTNLWDLASLNETEQVAEILASVSILQLQEANGVTSIQLHDLVLDIAKHEASKRYETQSFTRTLIGNYLRSSKRSNDATITARKEAPQGTDEPTKCIEPEQVACDATASHAWLDTDDDGYLHSNLCRLLRNAGYGDELLRLLSQPQWIVTRLLNAGIFSLEQDLEEGKSVLTGSTSVHSDHREHLEMVGKAARMSSTFVSENHREVWFQLHGRLLLHARQNERTREFVEKLEHFAPRPWVKASIGLLQQASKAAPQVIRARGTVLCMKLEQENLWIIWRSTGDIGVSRYNLSTGSYKSVAFNVESTLPSWPRCAAFMHEQGSVVSVHNNGKMYIWNRETGELERAIPLEGRRHRRWPVSKLDFCWRLRFPKCFGTSELDHMRVDSESRFAFSADGRFASICTDGFIRTWDTLRGEVVGEPLRSHKADIACIARSPDGSRIVSGLRDYTVRVWDSLSGEAVGQPLRGHESPVNCMVVSPDGSRIVSGSIDETLRVWDLASGAAVGQPLCGHTTWVTCVAVSPDGSQIVSGSEDTTVRVWDLRSGEPIGQPFRGHTAEVTHVAVSPDRSRILSASSDGTVRVWDAQSWKAAEESLFGHTEEVDCVAVSPDGSRIVSGSADKTLRVWNALSGEAVGQPLRGHTGPVICVTVTLDGSRIVSGSFDNTVRLWDAQSGEAVGEPLRGHTSMVTCVAVSADNCRIVSGSYDETVRVWDAKSQTALGQPLCGHTVSVTCVAVSGDGSQIVSGCWDNTLRVWDVESGSKVRQVLCGHGGFFRCVAMSHDGTRIVSGSSDGTVRVWDSRSGREAVAPLKHSEIVLYVGIDANCSRIASIGSGNERKVWDARSGECLLSSEDASWQSTVSDLLPLSFNNWRWYQPDRQVRWRADDGSQVVLATCEEYMGNVNGGDTYWSQTFKSCRIER